MFCKPIKAKTLDLQRLPSPRTSTKKVVFKKQIIRAPITRESRIKTEGSEKMQPIFSLP